MASPYATFVQFAHAIAASDWDKAKDFVIDREWVDTAKRLGWNQPVGAWRVAPGTTDENAEEMVFFRGPREAYRVTFEQRSGDWLISGFRTTTTSIE